MYATLKTRYVFILCLLGFLNACIPDNKIKNNIHSDDDQRIGQSIDEELLAYFAANNQLLDSTLYNEAYSFIQQIAQEVELSNHIDTLKNEFDSHCSLQIRIIDQVSEDNAFMLPGGYIYFHKNFLKGLQSKAQLTGVMAHLASAECHRLAVHKLENRFSTSFLIDLALGGEMNINAEMILSELKDQAYDTTAVHMLDQTTEKIICELTYDIRSYADLFNQNQTTNLDWHNLFPRNDMSFYTSYLYNEVKPNALCNNSDLIGIQEYSDFKSNLN